MYLSLYTYIYMYVYTYIYIYISLQQHIIINTLTVNGPWG